MKTEMVAHGLLRWHVRVYGMDSTLGAATLQAKAHAVRLFSRLRHDIDRAEKCALFCSAVECVFFALLCRSPVNICACNILTAYNPWILLRG